MHVLGDRGALLQGTESASAGQDQIPCASGAHDVTVCNHYQVPRLSLVLWDYGLCVIYIRK